MRARFPPRILFTVDDREAIICDVEPAVFIDGGGVRRGGDVEGEAADEGVVVESQQAGYEGEFVGRDAGAGL